MQLVSELAKRVLPAIVAAQLRNTRDRRRVRAAVRALANSASKRNRKGEIVLRALELTAANRGFDAEEQHWIDKIEQQRLQMLAQRQMVTLLDYGAPAAGQPSQYALPLGRIAENSRSGVWAEFLFRLVRMTKPERVVELGSCVGISASYIAAALEINRRGRLITLEGAPRLAEIVDLTLSHLKLRNRAQVVTGPFATTLQPTLVSLRPVDFVFHDGEHSANAYTQDFDAMRAHLAQDAIIVFDDIRWGKSNTLKGWQRIAADEAVSNTFDCGAVGVMVAKGI